MTQMKNMRSTHACDIITGILSGAAICQQRLTLLTISTKCYINVFFTLHLSYKTVHFEACIKIPKCSDHYNQFYFIGKIVMNSHCKKI